MAREWVGDPFGAQGRSGCRGKGEGAALARNVLTDAKGGEGSDHASGAGCTHRPRGGTWVTVLGLEGDERPMERRPG